MNTKDHLIQEINQAPEFLLQEVLNFFLFLKLRLSQRSFSNSSISSAQTNPELFFLAESAGNQPAAIP
ncbi:hypothetical protein [Neosynechococcus sphagnicola]|uniref:hypothetical protein n=1 Tax=Neosynechococcus sphagnicola TaxID=1501145 RepID=UPI00068C1749|nr:hypothetical protein [Neosynechococcus sphagnicola]